MTDPDPNETPIRTVPSTETTRVRPAPAESPGPGIGNGATAMTLPPLAPDPPEQARPREERVVPPPPPTSTVLPRTSPPALVTSPGRAPAPGRVTAAAGSRWMVIHPHVSFFGWLADRQGPAEATPEDRLVRYRRDAPWLFRVCVVLDLLVLFVVTTILVGALAAVLFKAIFGIV